MRGAGRRWQSSGGASWVLLRGREPAHGPGSAIAAKLAAATRSQSCLSPFGPSSLGRYCGLRALPGGRSTDGMYARGRGSVKPQNTTSSGISPTATTTSRLRTQLRSGYAGRPVDRRSSDRGQSVDRNGRPQADHPISAGSPRLHCRRPMLRTYVLLYCPRHARGVGAWRGRVAWARGVGPWLGAGQRAQRGRGRGSWRGARGCGRARGARAPVMWGRACGSEPAKGRSMAGRVARGARGQRGPILPYYAWAEY